jgi:hypothetical protein
MRVLDKFVPRSARMETHGPAFWTLAFVGLAAGDISGCGGRYSYQGFFIPPPFPPSVIPALPSFPRFRRSRLPSFPRKRE